MQALWLENQQLTFRDNIGLPELKVGEALIRTRLAGICSTDLELIKGYYPFRGILGHEFVGEVIEAPGNSKWIGKRVVGEINLSCGECFECRAGRKTHCKNRTVLGIKNKNGVFAEFFTLPVRNLYTISDTIPDKMAVFCEPLAAAFEIQQQLHIKPSDRVLVIGAGRLGQLIIQTLSLTSCNLFAVVRREKQRKLLEGRSVEVFPHEQLTERSYDIVIEVTGSPDGFELARRAVRPRGTIVLKSTYEGKLTCDVSQIVVDEITLIGSRCGPFLPAIRLLDSRQIDPRDMIEEVFSLRDGEQAFELASQPGIFKVLIRPD